MSSQGASYRNGTFEPDYYAILGVPKNASSEEIKNRYKALVLKLHPDREGSALAADAMVWINKAYEVLSDPSGRQAYDQGPEIVPERVQPEGATTQHHAGQTPGREPRIVVDEMGRNVRALVMVVMASACLAGLLALQKPEAGSFTGEYIGSSHDIITNWVHEGLVSLPLLIPGFGVAWGFLAVFTTGMIDRAVFVAAPGIQGSVAGNLVWYAVLSAGLKVLACYIGMCRSLLLVLSVRRRFHKMRCFHVGTDILIVLFLYELAALVEFMMAINA